MLKVKIFIGLFYLIIITALLFYVFLNFSFQEITSYDFIKYNKNYFFELKETNLFLLCFVFIIFTIVWIFAAGIATPVELLAGFLFDKWLGSFLLVFGVSIGSTCLYVFANLYFKDLIKKKFLSKFQVLEGKFKKSEFIYLLIYRFIGGIPFPVANVLPCLFNVKISNYFYAILIGIIPRSFIMVSIGSGFQKISDKNNNLTEISYFITEPEIYLPIIFFFFLFFITVFIRKFFYRD